MSYTKDDCIRETNEHIAKVRSFLTFFINGLVQRAFDHDASKIVAPEVDIFTKYTPKLQYTSYMSDEYKTYLKEMQVALKHHYEANSHHPEHFKKHVCNICFQEYKEIPTTTVCENCFHGSFTEESDYTQMNLLDIVEMFCDWYAASMRHADGDIRKSIEVNKERFKMSNDIAQIFLNTVDLLER